jgi:uncharacterized protein YaiI (UPF0178 family)
VLLQVVITCDTRVSGALAKAETAVADLAGQLFDAREVRKTVVLSHLYIKTNISPRQARDKHRENSKKDYRFSYRSSCPVRLTPQLIVLFCVSDLVCLTFSVIS